MPTSNWSFIARELVELFYEEKQMTSKIGASSAAAIWTNIDWSKVEKAVNRLQMRIAKAKRKKHLGKVKALQWLLTHSRNAKLLAVRRVTSSKGARTAGIDGKLYRSKGIKLQLAVSLAPSS